MASRTRALVSCAVLALGAAACGNLSNDDLSYALAVPKKGDLRVAVPALQAQPACGAETLGTADSWQRAQGTGASINAGVDGILALLDVVRAQTPSVRTTWSRTWGPYPDDKHPGVRLRVRMEQELDAKGLPWEYLYVFEATRDGSTWLPIVDGELFGAQASNGIGRLTIHFDNSRTLAVNQPDDPTAPGRVLYDLSGDPRVIELDVTQAGGTPFGLQSFDYAWAGYRDGHAFFSYALPSQNGCRSQMSATFSAQGAGRGTIHYECGTAPLLVQGNILECWSPAPCLTFLDDPTATVGACAGRPAPCVLGSQASCPAFP